MKKAVILPLGVTILIMIAGVLRLEAIDHGNPGYDMKNPTMEICNITLPQAGTMPYRVYVSSLMGLANRRMPSIYLDQNDVTNNRIKSEMELSGFKFIPTTLAALNAKFLKPDLVKGCIIVDEGCVRTPLAASLAGALDGVIVTPSMRLVSPYRELKVLYDAQNMTEAELSDYIFYNAMKFNLTGIVNYSSRSSNANFAPWQMIDFAIKYKYPMCGVDVSSKTISSTSTLAQLFNLLEPNSPHFGWAVPIDPREDKDAERQNVKFGAVNNAIYTVPGESFTSMSLFSTRQIEPLPLNQNRTQSATPVRKNVHYVTIIFSDGDNMAYYKNKFTGNAHGDYILSPKAGNVPLNYMYPPHLRTALTPLHNFYQRNMPANNYLVCGLSGIGYTLPSHSTAEQQAEHYRQTNQAMKECGLDYLVVMDEGTKSFNGEGITVRSRFVDNMQYMPDVKGIFYMHYQEYSRYHGECFFLDGVPVVSFRYCLWDEGKAATFRNPATLAADLNAASRDVTSIDAYSAVMAHVNRPSYYDVNRIVDELVPLLKGDVVIVDAAQFMELIKKNVDESSK